MMVRMTSQVKPQFRVSNIVSGHFLRAGLSLFILFHLAVIVIMANGGSYLGRSFQAQLLPYANSLGLNATWNFFSPDPAHTMFYKYRVFFEDELGNETQPTIEGFFPPEKTHVVIDSSKRRLLYSMRFLTIDPSRIRSLMGPWLCKQHTGARRVRIEYVVEQIPLLDTAVSRRNEPMENLVTERNLINNEISCQGPADEVSL
jgi:hypothetical protein